MENNLVRGFPLGSGSRVLLGLWVVFLISGFLLAASLEPDPRGYGTHQGLGLPPCSFQVLFDISCPSCGSTTCFSHFVRGQWVSAVRANVSAFLLALVCAAMVPWGIYSVIRGQLWNVRQPATAFMWLLLSLCGVSLTQWIIRLLFF